MYVPKNIIKKNKRYLRFNLINVEIKKLQRTYITFLGLSKDKVLINF